MKRKSLEEISKSDPLFQEYFDPKDDRNVFILEGWKELSDGALSAVFTRFYIVK